MVTFCVIIESTKIRMKNIHHKNLEGDLFNTNTFQFTAQIFDFKFEFVDCSLHLSNLLFFVFQQSRESELIASPTVTTVFAFVNPTFTAETLFTFIAVINTINCIGVAVTAIIAVLCIAIFAQIESVLGTIGAPDFLLTAIVETCSSWGTVQASVIVTISTLFHIHAVHTEPSVTGNTLPLPTTIQTVLPVADST